ncbi:MAG: ldh2 [Myxococcaceae bacterium]|nr:ldh2 [Myxococcaceae bacterium]
MDISIIGASGAVGRQIAIGLVRAGLVPSNARLQLVGRKGGPSEQTLPGVATDLADAFAEDLPELDLAFEPKDVVGDIIILAAGDSVGRGDPRTRADLAVNNRQVVESYARAIARHGHGEELLLVLTNPVEACVHWCARHIDRRRVIGMGAYLDSMRFRQEIAHDLGVRRQRVQGLVLGEHGPRMVPCWSTVDVHGFESPEGRARVRSLQRPRDPGVEQALQTIGQIARTRGPRAAYAATERFGPALRAVVKPMITQISGARSSASTAEMILRMLSTLLSGGQVLTAAQVELAGEFLGLHGVVGAPIVLTLGGVDRVVQYDLTQREQREVRSACYVDPEASPRKRPRTRPVQEHARAWECVLTMRSGAKPGTAERASAVFAGRGISLRSVLAQPGHPAIITLRFVASPQVKDHLTRRLARMRDVVKLRVVRVSV